MTDYFVSARAVIARMLELADAYEGFGLKREANVYRAKARAMQIDVDREAAQDAVGARELQKTEDADRGSCAD